MSKRHKQKLFSLLGFLAVLLAVLLFVVLNDLSSQKNNSEEVLAGIQQKGSLLGEASSQTTLVYFGDLRCPICASFTNNALPEIIDKLVRSNKINMEYKSWATLGEPSALAAKGALAAGEQDRLWDFIQKFYSTNPSSSTEVTKASLRKIAEQSGVENISQWEKDLSLSKWDNVLRENSIEAKIFLKFRGTPSFAVIKDGGPPRALSLGANSSVDDFARQLEIPD